MGLFKKITDELAEEHANSPQTKAKAARAEGKGAAEAAREAHSANPHKGPAAAAAAQLPITPGG